MTYPEPGYVLPCHFNHPVTGKETSEVEWNKSLNIKPSDIPESLKLVKIYLKE
jgi:hypothetical protein